MGYEDVSWEKALAAGAEKLAAATGDDFLMVISPQLSNEDLFAAQKFSRQVMGSENIISSLMVELGEDYPAFIDLATGSNPIETIEKAEGLFALNFDSRFGYAPAGVRVKRAASAGVPLVTIGDADSNLDILAEAGFRVDPSKGSDLLELLTLMFQAKKNPAKFKPASHLAEQVECAQLHSL